MPSIARYAPFEGTVKEGQTTAFRTFANNKLVPLWTSFDHGLEARAMFGKDRDKALRNFR